MLKWRKLRGHAMLVDGGVVVAEVESIGTDRTGHPKAVIARLLDYPPESLDEWDAGMDAIRERYLDHPRDSRYHNYMKNRSALKHVK